MEDYKKKYEDALERAKVINPKTADYEVAVKIFPELKENEDEKIRKEIIRIVDIWTNSCPTVNGIPAETLLAWLEKQGEQKPAWSEKDEKMWSTISDLLWEGFKLSDGKVSWDKIRCWLLPKITYFKDRVQTHSNKE